MRQLKRWAPPNEGSQTCLSFESFEFSVRKVIHAGNGRRRGEGLALINFGEGWKSKSYIQCKQGWNENKRQNVIQTRKNQIVLKNLRSFLSLASSFIIFFFLLPPPKKKMSASLPSSSSGPDASQFDGSRKSAAMDKYSRQVGAYGVGVMKFLREYRILIVGLKGVGIETAKDLVLTGPLAVHIHDNGLAEIADLGCNFFLSEQSVGQPRAAACLSHLQELNDDVEVQAVSEPITHELLARCGAVIVTDNPIPLATLEDWDAFCVSKSICFEIAFSSGPSCFMFSDFGNEHEVTDANGEPHIFVAIKNISISPEDGKLEIELDEAHGLDDGIAIQFEDVEGVPQLQGPPLVAGSSRPGPSRPFKISRRDLQI